jgi:hypothetical protein
MDDLIIGDGTDQDHRFPGPLETGYFNVDESTFESLAAAGADFADCLGYYSLENKALGSWKSLFTADEAMVFAMILSFDLKSRLVWFAHLSEQKEIKAIAQLNCRLARQINTWYEDFLLINNSLARDYCLRIRHLIEKKLRSDLNTLGEIHGLFYKDNHSLGVKGLHPIWYTLDPGPESMKEPGKDPEKNNLGFLSSCFYNLHAGIEFLKKHAGILLEQSLKSGTHSPSAGLYLTFIHLFEKIRTTRNSFTQRHLDFYYKEVLRCRVREPVPDRVWLCVKKAPRTTDGFIPKGTGFPAPSDKEDTPRVYFSDHDLLVTGARVESLKTLFYDRDPLAFPESDMDMITSTQVHTIPLMESMDVTEAKTGWPIFGVRANRAAQESRQDAFLGFAVSAPILLLREGRRRISVSLQLDRPGKAMEENGLFAGFLDRAASLAETSREDLFYKVFSKMFTISLTTATGWLEVANYLPAIHSVDNACTPGTLEIGFELDSDMPPIEPWSQEIHESGYETKFPVMRFVVNPEAYTYPCSILDDYFIKEIKIHAQVKGLRNLLLYNNLGRLDPNTPFQPFGPLPALGSYFIAGAYEASIKPIIEFNLGLEWGGLPLGKGGFKDHYGAYGLDIGNETFKTHVSLLQNGGWQPGPDTINRTGDPEHQEIRLFREQKEGSLSNRSCLTTKGIDFSRLDQDPVPEDNYGFDINTRSGFFKFTLTNPEQAFGHREYPFLLTEVLTHNAKPSRFTRSRDLPHPPYTPMVNFIAADYIAESVIRPGLRASAPSAPSAPSAKNTCEETLFSLHPFGLRRVFPLSKQKKCFVIPDYHKQGLGNLFIGLSSLRPGGRLTLFFHLLDDSRATSSQAMPFVRWFCLCGDQWKKLSKKQVVSDTTGGFLSSGIVTLDIPEEMNCDNTLFDEKLYWIRACANRHLTGASSLFAVQAHGVSATLGDPEARTSPLASGSIDQSLSVLPGIAAITQPLPSFDGREVETEDAMKTRVSERLKHKNRAVTPWDFERLILEKFPQVSKVKCFPGINSRSWRCWERRQLCVDATHWDCRNCKTFNTQNQPGHLLIVVIPWFNKKEGTLLKDPEPMANAMLLGRIKSHVKKCSSAFATIEVRNPVYEKIQIRCTVRFKNQENLWGNKRKLDQAISEFISPWTDIGYQARFGWRIRSSDLISHIQEQPYVSFLTNYSMLRITGNNEERFELFDTATRGAPDSSRDPNQVGPKYPWSIAVNADHHFIETTSEVKAIMPEPTGLEELEVGQTFIISG